MLFRSLAGHVLGYVNAENLGVAGMEKAIDRELGLADLRELGFAGDRGLKPKRLSLDIRVQHVLRDEMSTAQQRFHAVAAVGIVLDVHTLEVLGMVSLPDYDPNHPAEAVKADQSTQNRATGGVFEMGSVFKTFNSALALDSGKIQLSDTFDVTPLQFGSQRIGEFHSKGHPLSVPEIFLYSSNNGSARMALKVGSAAQNAFFNKMGLLKRIDTELPEVALPLHPRTLSDVSTATMSFGHGISVSPMHTAVGGAALVNGGYLINPTFLPRTREEADKLATRVIRPETSDKIRSLFRLNATPGSGGSSKRVVANAPVGARRASKARAETRRAPDMGASMKMRNK